MVHIRKTLAAFAPKYITLRFRSRLLKFHKEILTKLVAFAFFLAGYLFKGPSLRNSNFVNQQHLLMTMAFAIYRCASGVRTEESSLGRLFNVLLRVHLHLKIVFVLARFPVD